MVGSLHNTLDYRLRAQAPRAGEPHATGTCRSSRLKGLYLGSGPGEPGDIPAAAPPRRRRGPSLRSSLLRRPSSLSTPTPAYDSSSLCKRYREASGAEADKASRAVTPRAGQRIDRAGRLSIHKELGSPPGRGRRSKSCSRPQRRASRRWRGRAGGIPCLSPPVV